MNHLCAKCRVVMLKEDRRRKLVDRYQPLGQAQLELRQSQAPRVRCVCGHLNIIINAAR